MTHSELDALSRDECGEIDLATPNMTCDGIPLTNSMERAKRDTAEDRWESNSESLSGRGNALDLLSQIVVTDPDTKLFKS